MSAIATFVKDPDETLDYKVEWAEWLEADTIATSTWTFPDGITKGTDEVVDADQSTVVWASGGTEGVDYELLNRVVTNAGRIADRTITLMVRSR